MSRSEKVSEACESADFGQAEKIPGLAVVVMAAGLGKRMRSKQAKVLHPVAGQPMVLYSVRLALRLATHRVAVVVGHQADRVREVVQTATLERESGGVVTIVEQRQQLGTGHAVLQSRPEFSAGEHPAPRAYLILNGDTPLLRECTVRSLLRTHEEQKATVTILTAVLSDAAGYGRVVRSSAGGAVARIVEDRDASPEEAAIREINVGTYVVDGNFLFAALDRLEPSNAQGEYYLTDIIDIAAAQGRHVAALVLDNPDEGLGVNTRSQLAEAEHVIRRNIRDRWLESGVTMIDPSSTWIDAGVRIGRDSTLFPNVALEGDTALGEDCIVRAGTRITDCVIGNHVEILDHCVLRDARIEDGATVGPFVHLRPGVVIRKKAKVGNFVEMKKADLGEGAKANHLSYLGDAKIGRDVNIGAGTITCNYDGARKFETIIGDSVFIGSDTQLVAPVTIGARAIIAAGTTVTKDVSPDALVIARVPQVNREGWAARRRALQADVKGQGHGVPAAHRLSATSRSPRESADVGTPEAASKKTGPSKKRGRG